MTTATKEQTGITGVGDRHGDERLATKATVSITYQDADGFTLTDSSHTWEADGDDVTTTPWQLLHLISFELFQHDGECIEAAWEAPPLES
jgi:hypothetical protein